MASAVVRRHTHSELEYYEPSDVHLNYSVIRRQFVPFFPMAQQPIVGQGVLIIEASRSHSDTPHWAGLLWTSDKPDAEASTCQHTTLTGDRHPCLQHDSNLQSQQASSRRPTR
jgi:hypothetical protein